MLFRGIVKNLEAQGSFGGLFLFEVLHFTMLFRGIGLSKLEIRNSNVFLRMCFRMGFRECVSNFLLVW